MLKTYCMLSIKPAFWKANACMALGPFSFTVCHAVSTSTLNYSCRFERVYSRDNHHTIQLLCIVEP